MNVLTVSGMRQPMISAFVNFVSFVILVFCLASKSMTAGCLYEVEGCRCSISGVACYGLQEFPQPPEKPDAEIIRSAEFWWGSFTDVPSKSVPEGLTTISFFETPITKVADDAFQNCDGTLNDLVFYLPSFTALPSALRYLPNLTSLVIASAPIEDWNNVTLQSLSGTLQKLTLKNVSLTTWPKWLSSFTSLTSLDVSGNSFTSIPEDAFTQWETTLVLLDLSDVGLTQLPAGLSSLVNLANLQLDKNKFTDVNNRSWAEQLSKLPLENTLFTLVLDSVGLTDVPDLTGFAGLRIISMQYNEITEITSDRFPLNISIINVGNNNITEITDTSFQNCTTIEVLTLSNNPISAVSTSAFSSLVNLETLFFGHSRIREFPESLSGLKKLTYADLTGAPLECPCPINPQIVKWYYSFSGTFSASCVDGRKFTDYIHHSCRTTTTPGEATRLASHSIYTSVCLVLLLFIHHCFN